MSEEKVLKAPKEKGTGSKGTKAIANLGNLNTINLGGVVGEKAKVNTKKDQLHIPINLIEEDPLNVRVVFNELGLEQLAESIKENGVLTPISIRENPEKPGNYIINNGARRFRASKIACQEFIPAFIDNEHDELNQMIDNIQREDLSILEIAEKIKRLIDEKKFNKGTLAKRAGKPAAWVSKHLSALSMPPLLKFLYESGQCNDLEAINMIVNRWEKNGVELHKWLESFQGTGKLVTQAGVRKLLKSLDEKEEKQLNQKENVVQIDIDDQIEKQIAKDSLGTTSPDVRESAVSASTGDIDENVGNTTGVVPKCFDKDLSVDKGVNRKPLETASSMSSNENNNVEAAIEQTINLSKEDSTIAKAAKVLTVLNDIDQLTPIFKDDSKYVSLKISLRKGTNDESKALQSKAVSKLLSTLEDLRKEFPSLDLDIAF
ncbi:ParB/RepB/Spo0J family partition protein [Acinetobacter soli]|uniref:ParB/RepB/Spo0J family partition protein n=1 Tax=Acinetobacter soli TaxID=487316 RepID=UPI00125DE36B|nr:ParB/RepB/Spo0J family partition protein [Acinetobacter soli]